MRILKLKMQVNTWTVYLRDLTLYACVSLVLLLSLEQSDCLSITLATKGEALTVLDWSDCLFIRLATKKDCYP